MSWLHALRERARNLFDADQRDRETDEEIQHHLELEIQRHVERGHAPDDARGIALARFGRPEWVRQATRDARGAQPMENAVQDVGWAVRSLRKNAGFTTLALLTLALGIGATTAAFSVLDRVLLRPLPFGDPGELVLIQELDDQRRERPPSYPNFDDWRAQTRAFEGVVSLMYPSSVTATAATAAEPVRVPMAGVSRGFFRTLGIQPVVGREFTAEENAVAGGAQVLMVTHEFWQTQMGGRMPLGSIRVGGDPWEVVGVLPPRYRLVVDAELFWPHERAPGTIRNAHNYIVIGRLSDDATLAAARLEMTALSRRLHEQHGTETGAVDARVTPLQEYLVGDYRTLLGIVFAAAVLVLLIACTNLVSAQLARGLTRQREVAVRAALGASRGRLVRQMFLESTLLAAGGAVLGVLLAFALVRVIRYAGGDLVPRLDELRVDGPVLGFTLALAGVTALLVGFYPALRLTRSDPGNTLRGAARATSAPASSRIWPLLVGFEVAMAVVLLFGSALLVQTMRNILESDVGFDPGGVLTVSLSPGELGESQLEQIRLSLASLPGVEGAAYVSRLPLSWGNVAAPVLRPEDAPTEWPAVAGYRVATPGYFSVLRQPLLSGREFAATDRAGTPAVAIVTEGLARALWPGEDAVGKTVRTNYLATQWLTVVGVAREASSWTMPRGTQHEIFVPLAQQPEQSQLVAVMRTAGDPTAVTASVRARLRELAPATPVRIETMLSRIERSASDRQFVMIAFLAFAGIALLLAAIGIYGVMSYSTASRTYEIGVRLALGALPLAVLGHVMRNAVAMALSGIVLGSAVSLIAGRYIESVLYGVSRFDPTAFLAGSAILLVTALAGAFIPARRSSRVDPLVVMRGG